MIKFHAVVVSATHIVENASLPKPATANLDGTEELAMGIADILVKMECALTARLVQASVYLVIGYTQANIAIASMWFMGLSLQSLGLL